MSELIYPDQKLVYCYQKLEKTVTVDGRFIIPSYGSKVNEFNEFLKVIDVDNRDNKIFITLEEF